LARVVASEATIQLVREFIVDGSTPSVKTIPAPQVRGLWRGKQYIEQVTGAEQARIDSDLEFDEVECGDDLALW
jgi:hypothetical protein